MKKKGNKKMPRPRQEIIDNPIPTSLFFNGVQIYNCSKSCIPITHKQQNSCIVHKQRCRDNSFSRVTVELSLKHYTHACSYIDCVRTRD